MKIYPYLFLPAASFMLCQACHTAGRQPAGIQDTALYIRTGNPDTALAIFLYKDCYQYEYHAQREEYIRYETDHDKISHLYTSLWSQKPDYQARLQRLEANQEQFVKDARNAMHEQYRHYRSVSNDMIYHYLLGRKDPELKQLLLKISTDTAAPDEEKINALETLKGWQ
ncbi:hypothetical protein EGT74_03965 [Chitinophaga lutea]|uniref:Uncharacterized protein n=1 Tax=Chitinophaga lutea TaxID=2488634 RepID=A0A3N4Q5C2_9BACT|nr:hypothetical protein [Chitinophaga lutea]RPE12711.1 hypothetical protein EGT74_03965 [Chitinophaga lutea]